ncbi:MAG: M15 family metallopeptidase [Lachnospiraceae bacterium]|nr:M15 family metallopeptidase [Lachnospiraceae bacterium]
MAYCNDSRITECFGGKQLPKLWGEWTQDIKNEVTGYQTKVTLKRRTSKNGSLSEFTLQVHKAITSMLQDIFNEIASNPNVAIDNNYGGFFIRHMNSGSSSGNSYASIHSTGCAVDVNFGVNPLHSNMSEADTEFKMRTTSHPIVQAFMKRGFDWGGKWSNRDAMHFELSSRGSSGYSLGEASSSMSSSNLGGGGGGYVSPGKYTPVEWAPPNDGGTKSFGLNNSKGSSGMVIGIHVNQK